MGKKSRRKKQRLASQQKQQLRVSVLPVKTLFIYIVILIAVCLGIYWQSLNNDFVNLDDNEHVYENPYITSLSSENISRMFTESRMGNWIPLTQISYAVDYHIWGMDAWGFHLSNLILHIMNTLLVLWLVWLLCGNNIYALLSALIFAVHPLHVESVAWITERKDVLYALFYLLAMIVWIYGRRQKKSIFYWLTMLLFALSLLAKSMAVTLPLLLILYDIFYLKKSLKKSIIDKIPFFALSLAAVIITWQATYSETSTFAQLNIFERMLMANYAFWFYPFKLLLPFNLSAIYPYPQGINEALPGYYYLLPLLTAGLVWILYKQRKKALSITFWFWFYLITILPVLQLLPLAGSSITCDRFTYLPSIGIFMIIMMIMAKLFTKADLNNLMPAPGISRSLLIIFAIVIAAMSILSWQRTKVWKNGVTLHSDIIARYPEIELPWINRGKAYSVRGEHGKAISDFSMAIKVKPNSADAYNNRGNEYGDLQEYDKGIADLSQAIELRADFAEAYSNRAHLYQLAGDYQLAERDFAEAIRIDPTYAAAWYNRGNLHRQLKNYSQAIEYYQQAVKLKPDGAEIYNNMGTASSMAGDFKSAVRAFNKALQLEPGNVSFLNNRGNAHKDAGDNTKALADFNLAVRLEPRYSNAYHNRAVVYYQLGDIAAAKRDLQKVKSLGGYINPAFEQALSQK